ncbi:MAG: translocation/assembly module TamB, partial [Treponemataceae bacterium]|nr:translocation/assembly module TamB [Treponemataceae bacterium]
ALVSPEKLRIGFQEIRQVNQPILDGELTVTGLFQKKMKGFLALSNAITGEQYQLEMVTPEAGGLEVRLNFKGALAGRFSPTVPVKSATGELRYVADDKGHFNVSWALPTIKILVNDQECTISSLGSLDNQELLSEKTSIQYGNIEGTLSNIVLDRQKGTLTFTGEIVGPLLGKESSLSFENRSTFTSPSSWTDFFTPDFYKVSLVSVFSLTKGTWDSQPVKPFSVWYEQDQYHMLIHGGPEESLSIRLDREGNLYGSLSKPLPLNALFEGSIRNQVMSIQIHSFVIDVPSLWKYLPFQTLLTFSQGTLVGNLQLSGTIQDPQIEGTVIGEQLRFNLTEWVLDSCTVPQARFVFEHSMLRLEPVRGMFPTGETTISASMQFERWVPQNFQLTLQTEREKAIPYRIALLGLTAQGFGYGTLFLSFTEDLFTLTGNLWATNSTITYLPEEIKQADFSSAGPHIITNLILYTDKNVAFLWPSQDFPVLRAYSDAGSSLQILSNSQTGRFSLRGTIQLRTGEVYYLQRNFFLRRGKLVFNENEIKVDPTLSILAELRDRTENGPVTITMVVDNTPLSRFVPRFESSPALSQSEIFAILGQNVVSPSLQGTLLTISSDVLTQFGIMRYFEQNVRSTLGLDMFSIRTQVLQNALVQASGVTEERTLQKNRGIGNYFDNTTVYIGKYFGPDLFLQSLVSLKYDEQQANTFAGGLSIESEVGLELRTPLFMIEWNITPKHQEHLFMSDQSLTITWKWSF